MFHLYAKYGYITHIRNSNPDNNELELKSPRDMPESTQQTKEVFRPTIQLRNRFSVLSVDDNYPADEDNGEIEIEHTLHGRGLIFAP